MINSVLNSFEFYHVFSHFYGFGFFGVDKIKYRVC